MTFEMATQEGMMAQQRTPMQATDTFVATTKDGGDRLVTKGQVLAWGDELVQRDLAGSGTLFRPLDMGGEDDAPAEPKSAPQAKAEAKAAAPAVTVPPRAGAGKPVRG